MPLSIYDSKTRQLQPFKPLQPGKVGLYLCGPTVQGAPHLGHLRAALNFDVLVRWLKHSGYQVTYVRNVTDIDDKILQKSEKTGIPWWALASHFEREFNWAYQALNTLPPTVTPHATGHIPAQIALIKRLIERGHAYTDNQGNVYFSVTSLPDYGSLTHQKLSDLKTTEDETQTNSTVESTKQDPRDFAMWKAAKPGEPADASWDSPWGRGRPGWHLECSAMSQAYLSDSFDIHGGGLDLRFPHHENEQAQSHAAGWDFAQHWMHNAWLTLKGEKMSKSVGNVVGVRHLLDQWDAPVVRLSVLTTHYRTNLEFSEESLVQAETLWQKFFGFITAARNTLTREASEQTGSINRAEMIDDYGEFNPDLARIRELGAVELPQDFVAAMDEDLNVPAALPAMHRAVKLGKEALRQADTSEAKKQAQQLRAMLDILGLDPLDTAWGKPSISSTDKNISPGKTEYSDAGNNNFDALNSLNALVTELLRLRAEAKTAKDWARADEIRSLLENAAGLPVKDTPTGTFCGPVQPV